jgi:histidine triad (HIT) family protein
MPAMATDCIFCKIAAGKIPAARVHEEADLVAIRDINPQAPTHILLLPRQHVGDLLELEQQDDGRLAARLLRAAAEVARREGLEANGFRVVINTGPYAGQTVPHLHLHILGGRHLGWPPG